MKRIFALLLVLCVALPLCAAATHERVWDMTEETLTSLHDRYDALLEQTTPGLPYPNCCNGMSDKDRLLYVALTYDKYLRTSGGLCSFLLEEPEMYADLREALIMTGNAEHLDLLFFTREIDTGRTSLFHLAGSLHRSLAYAMYDFAAFDAKIEQDGYGRMLEQHLAQFITIEPLWHEDFETWLDFIDNMAFDIFSRVTDGPWPACADALNEEERTLFLCYHFLISWECGGMCGFLMNTEYELLSPTLEALERIAPASGHRAAIQTFSNESGLSLTDADALESFRRIGRIEYKRAAHLYPFDACDDALMAAEMISPLRDAIIDYILLHPDSFR